MKPGTYQTWKLVQYIGITTETSHRINAVTKSRGIHIPVTVFIFNIKPLVVCVKDRVYLKVAMAAYGFNVFGLIFGVLFCLFIKKLIIGSKTVRQSMRKLPRAVWSVRTFPNMDKKKLFFRSCTLVWSDSL